MESTGNTTIQTLEAAIYDSLIDNETYIFNGTPQSTVGYSFISTMISASEKGVLYVRHSMDGQTWDIVDSYVYPGTDVLLNAGMFNVTPAKALYVSVKFENTTNETNNIRLQTFLRNDPSSSLTYLTSSLNESLSGSIKYLFEKDINRIAIPVTGWSLDFRERPGWYFNGSKPSYLNWYYGPALAFKDLTAIYFVATFDSLSNLPHVSVRTNGTVWTYSMSPDIIIIGKTYLCYYGSQEPLNIPALPQYLRVQLNRNQTDGSPGLDTEAISDIYIEALSNSKFLVKSSGIWNQRLNQKFEISYETLQKNLVEDTYIVRDLTLDASFIVSANPAMVADPRGREGWWSSSQDDSLTINMYLQHVGGKKLMFSNLTGIYVILTPDTYERLPTISIAIGTFVPLTFTYTYTENVIPCVNEPVMFYIGAIPATVHETIPRYELSYIDIDIDPETSVSAAYINNIRLNLSAGSPVPFLLQYSGYIDNDLDRVSDLGRVRETRYLSGKQRSIDANLSSLTFNDSMLLTQTQARVRDGNGNPITSHAFGANRGLDVNVLPVSLNYHEITVHTGTILANSFSDNPTWTRGDYGPNSVLSYTDTSTSGTGTVSLFSVSGAVDLYLGSAYPINISGYSSRCYCFKVNLLPFDNIKIRNDSTSNLTAVKAVLRSA